MSSLYIYLGSCTGPEQDLVLASSLAEANNKALPVSNSVQELHVTLVGSELADVWNNPMDLSVFTKSLKDEAKIIVTIKGTVVQESLLKSLHTSFLLAGLVGTAEKKESDGSRVFTATKIPKEALPKSVPLNHQKAATINLDEEDDLIDEDNLLSDATNLLGIPPAMNTNATKNADDCSGREPCENCTCGRADNNGNNKNNNNGESKNIGSDMVLTKEKSACGKCSLGDAFRCASCPYLGKPAFKPGEEHLILDLQDDF